MGYSYEIAKEALNENDKNRLMCLYLNCNPSAINWEKATRDFGCASVDSMRVMTRTALKKIEKAGGKLDDDGNTVPATPTPNKSGGKKRKAATATPVVDADDDEDPTPTQKKPRKGKKSKVDTPVEKDDAEAEGGDENETAVKAEPTEDDEEA